MISPVPPFPRSHVPTFPRSHVADQFADSGRWDRLQRHPRRGTFDDRSALMLVGSGHGAVSLVRRA